MKETLIQEAIKFFTTDEVLRNLDYILISFNIKYKNCIIDIHIEFCRVKIVIDEKITICTFNSNDEPFENLNLVADNINNLYDALFEIKKYNKVFNYLLRQYKIKNLLK